MSPSNRKPNATPVPLRTPATARQWLRDQGITVVAFAKQHGLSRDAVTDVLRGTSKGNYGEAHQAAVALGIKPSPDSGTKSRRRKPTVTQ
ncbi:DNA-binding protein [Pseudoxanthomonas winnipegensis]|uniref:DNA-binding protein n=1 Tax=Pseudoxanthomonas winnipegensis TaxID=2480810 RepID=A0A4Q8LD21_9GAMM|nr:DNA-binding protein [Pseudoxanthomonas winnipegensis]TAA26556.1 DNA-binding protein [Pseudoxanthomonas winnipegensis]